MNYQQSLDLAQTWLVARTPIEWAVLGLAVACLVLGACCLELDERRRTWLRRATQAQEIREHVGHMAMSASPLRHEPDPRVELELIALCNRCVGALREVNMDHAEKWREAMARLAQVADHKIGLGEELEAIVGVVKAARE